METNSMSLSLPQIPALQTSGFGVEDLQSLSDRTRSGKKLSDQEIQKIGQQFESLLLHQLLSIMRRSIPKTELFGKNSAEGVYQDLFDEKMAEQVAQSGQTGISSGIVEEIQRQQEQVNPLSVGSRFIPLHPSSEKFSPLGEPGKLRPLMKETDPFRPLPDKNEHFLPINRKAGKIDKVDISA